MKAIEAVTLAPEAKTYPQSAPLVRIIPTTIELSAMCVVNVGVVPHDTHEPEPGCAVSFTWMQQMEPGCSASQMVTLEQGLIRALPMGVSTRLPAGEPSDMKFTGDPPVGPAHPRKQKTAP